jgi:hypothetical protein
MVHFISILMLRAVTYYNANMRRNAGKLEAVFNIKNVPAPDSSFPPSRDGRYL